MCDTCIEDVKDCVKENIKRLSLDKIINICLLLRQMGFINDIIRYIINDIP